MTNTRTCPQCNAEKPLLDFYYKGRRYLAACRDCQKQEASNKDTRKCKECGVILSLGAFKKRGSGRRTWLCPDCRKNKQASYQYDEDPNETHRICRQCGQNLPITSFVRERKSRGGRAATCKGCRKNRVSLRRTDAVFTVFGFGFSDSVVGHRRTRYGVNAVEQHDLILKTRGKCPICDKDFQSSTDIHFDHDHTTGKIRAVICQQCNILLGACKDDVNLLNNAARYLRRHS